MHPAAMTDRLPGRVSQTGAQTHACSRLRPAHDSEPLSRRASRHPPPGRSASPPARPSSCREPGASSVVRPGSAAQSAAICQRSGSSTQWCGIRCLGPFRPCNAGCPEVSALAGRLPLCSRLHAAYSTWNSSLCCVRERRENYMVCFCHGCVHMV